MLLSKKKIAPTLSNTNYSNWSNWSSTSYLNTYFSKIGQDSFENLTFLVQEMKKFKGTKKERILDFGCGPTVFSSLIAAPYATEIHMADFLSLNLDQVKKWINNHPKAFQWDHYTEQILRFEMGLSSPTKIKIRNEEAKLKISKLITCDASRINPIFPNYMQYPIVISNFCTDSVTASKKIWQVYTKNLLNLVQPKGHILLSALKECKIYRNGNCFYPSANINEDDVYELLIQNNFNPNSIFIEVKSVRECKEYGFEKLIFASAKKTSIS